MMLCFVFGISKPATFFANGNITHSDNTREACAIQLKVNYKGELNFQMLTNSITVIGTNGLIQKYSTTEINGYSFTCRGKLYKFVSINMGFEPDIKNGNQVFVRLEEEGPISLYRYYYKESLNNYFTRGSLCYISKNQAQLKRLNKHNDLLRAISDNKELYASLEKTNKNKIVDHMDIIIRYYNKTKPAVTDVSRRGLPEERD